jgi:hypothetical protein
VEAKIMNESRLITSIKCNKQNAVEVKRYYYGLQRFNALLLTGALLISLIGSYTFGQFPEYVTNKLNYEERLSLRYHKIVNMYKKNGKIYNESYEDYFEGMFNLRYKDDLIFIGISHTIWLVPLAIFIFWRFPPPIRFDRDKQIIYTWQMGKFYYARFDQIEPKFPKGHKLHTSADFGPLEISLFDADTKKEKRFRLGAHFAYKYQSGDLYQWLRAYMNHQVENDAFLSKNNQWLENSWVEKSIFTPRQLPEEKITQALALRD